MFTKSLWFNFFINHSIIINLFNDFFCNFLYNIYDYAIAELCVRIKIRADYKETLVFGRIVAPHADQNYPVVRSEGKNEAITALYNENSFVKLSFDGVDTEILVNATAADKVAVDLDKACDAVFYDVCGKECGTAQLAPGLQMLAIPVSGECILKRA